jgi:hypothetical protein
MLVHYELHGQPNIVNIFTRELSDKEGRLGPDRVTPLAVANDETEPLS